MKPKSPDIKRCTTILFSSLGKELDIFLSSGQFQKIIILQSLDNLAKAPFSERPRLQSIELLKYQEKESYIIIVMDFEFEFFVY